MKTKLLSIIAFLLIGYTAHAQSSTGLIDPARAMDWTKSGLAPVGGIPSGSWTQCGATITAYTGTATTIINAIAACGVNQYVLLGPGTFTLSTGWVIKGKNSFVVRGSGADTTFVVFAPGTAGVGCQGGSSSCGIGFNTNDGSFWQNPVGLTDWTAGFAQGGNSITLGSVTGILKTTGAPTTPATLIILDQDDDGYTGTSNPPTGNSVDPGGFFVCGQQYNAVGPVGCSKSGADAGFQRPRRVQQEIVEATNIVGSVVTTTPKIVHPNWRVGQFPQAWIMQPINYVGVENLSIDCQNTSAATCIGFGGVSYGWARGVRILNGKQSSLSTFMCTHMDIVDNYIYDSGQNFTFADNYGIRLESSALMRVQNNILQKNTAQLIEEGPGVGNVIGYNFSVNNYYNSDSQANAYRPHSAGDDYWLFEGNIGTDGVLDGDHGTHLMNTMFRNFFHGFESCGSVAGICGSLATWSGAYPAGTYGHKDSGLHTIEVYQYNRYLNSIANVLGTPGSQTTYRPTCGTNFSIYIIGCSNDLTNSVGSAYMWGNWDNVSAATHWCGNSSSTGWLTTCAGVSEVPTAFGSFPQPLPTLGDTGGALPKSLYLPASPAPSWFGSVPWPAIGPDVTLGTIGQCGGTKDSIGNFALLAATSASQCHNQGINMAAWAGHVNANPAMNCAINIMGMPVDGSGAALAFNADTCYGAAAPAVLLNPTSLAFGNVVQATASSTQTATITNSGTANLTITSFTTTSDYSVTTSPSCNAGCTVTPGNSVVATVTFTPTILGVDNGTLSFINNATGSAHSIPLTGTGVVNPNGVGLPQGSLIGMLWSNDKYAFYHCVPCNGSMCCPLPFGVKAPNIIFK